MKQSITQELDYGCGIACFAFAADQTYKQAAKHVGEKQAKSERFYVKDLRATLNSYGMPYTHKHMKSHLRTKIYREGTIVLIRPSKHYPSGHYLIRYEGYWMDPWINLPYDKQIKNAKSGFRKRLPGQPMYALFLPE